MKLRLLGSIFVVLAALAVFLAAPGAQAPVTVFVDDDHAECTAATFTSIAVAAATVPAGSTIIVCDGVYTEQVVISRSMTVQNAALQTPEIHYPATVGDGTLSIVHIT